MVREVEFSNESEILAELENYSNAPDQPLFEGYISDNGMTLNIKVHVPLSGELVAQRQLTLFFGNIDFDNRIIDYRSLDSTDLDYRVSGENVTDKIYTFDISKVLAIPRKLYSTGGTSEITIELYTYEANLTTDYGSRTLSVPYTVTNTTKYEYDKSTDGIYKLIMVDYDPWTSTRSYGSGDIVISGGALLMSTIDSNTDETTETSWTTPTDDDIFNYARGITKYPPIRAFITDMMVSRYAKYKLIQDAVKSKTFKGYDDTFANEMSLLLQSFRERAKYMLYKHRPIDAGYNLQLMKLTSSQQTDTTKVNTYNIKYTI